MFYCAILCGILGYGLVPFLCQSIALPKFQDRGMAISPIFLNTYSVCHY